MENRNSLLAKVEELARQLEALDRAIFAASGEVDDWNAGDDENVDAASYDAWKASEMAVHELYALRNALRFSVKGN